MSSKTWLVCRAASQFSMQLDSGLQRDAMNWVTLPGAKDPNGF